MLNNLKIGTKIGASFAVGLAFFATIGGISYLGINRLIDAARWEAHTYQVLAELEQLNSQIQVAESSQRAYLLTGDKRHIKTYDSAAQTVDKNITELRRLSADNSIQQGRISVLEPLVIERLAVIQNRINVRTNQGLSAVLQLAQKDGGRNISDNINQVINQMKNEERQLLQERSAIAQRSTRQTINSITYGIPFSFLILTLIGFLLNRNISKPLENISYTTEKLANGDLSVSIPEVRRRDEIGVLTQTFNQMIASLRHTQQKNDEQSWLKSNLAKFSRMVQGQRNLTTISKMILAELAPLVGAQQGVFYIMDSVDNQPTLKLLSSYAHQKRKHLANQFQLGEGLVGQCALEKEKIILTNVPSDYIKISSGLGEAPPLNIIVLPVLFELQVKAVIELASFQRFGESHLTFLDQVTEGIGVVLNTIESDMRNDQLLQQSQSLAEELQESNQRLAEQASSLQVSEELLKQQQEELQQSNEELQQLNEELEEKAELLAVQKSEVEHKNRELEQTRQSLEEKADQLALSSKYKSEFLANMSHELRTPLNSLLILARLLADNAENNLTSKQVEYSRTIHSAGTDLLEMINDILDLAKIESGTMAVEVSQVSFTDLQLYLERTFRQVAQQKGLNFSVEFGSNLPEAIYTDSKRLQQVLKNLLANAFKFTSHGQVSLRLEVATKGWNSYQETLNRADTVIAFSVIDTGIGIAPDKQQIIFEAFQQADGSTSRKYGGTGLGLSISREIARLLGGEIRLVSQLGQGSTFILYLPQGREEGRGRRGAASCAGGEEVTQRNSLPLYSSPAPPASPASPTLPDDRSEIQPGERVLLIVEDDDKFARILLDMARQEGFKCLVAQNGNHGLALARQFMPDGIMLDIRLPGMDGWMVLEHLKHDPNTRHIPVHILSVEEGLQRGLQLGAIASVQKPVTKEVLLDALTEIKGFVDRPVKNLLVVEDDEIQRQSVVELIGNGDVSTTAVGTGAAALAALRSGHFDCVVLDLGLPDMTGFELIELIKQEPSLGKLPIIVYTGKELSRAEETELKRMAETIIIKDVRSPERLFDETSLFLHRVQANLPEPKRQMLEQMHSYDQVLAGKKVLIVDDDVRNIFALTSMLELYQMQVLYAENGRDGIEVLQNTPDVDVVLMDVMMPEMDGYETMRAIRQESRFKSLPVIALTAKAMQGDREKCIEAGASDYITKPVDNEQLLSLLRVWLYG